MSFSGLISQKKKTKFGIFFRLCNSCHDRRVLSEDVTLSKKTQFILIVQIFKVYLV